VHFVAQSKSLGEEFDLFWKHPTQTLPNQQLNFQNFQMITAAEQGQLSDMGKRARYKLALFEPLGLNILTCGILWHPVASCGILCAKQQVIELLNPPYLGNIHDMVRSFLTSTLVTCCNPPSNISRGHQFQQAHEPKHPNESEDLRVPWFGSRWHRIQQRQVGSWAPVPGAMVGSWVVVGWCLLWPNSVKGFPHFLGGE
jgi:hypothetical protein